VRSAFKEWAVVVDALGQGRQIILLRKGGIAEGRGGFKVDETEFFLFPTLFHQQRENVVPSAQARFDHLRESFPPTDRLTLEYAAQVVEWTKLERLEQLELLRGQHIWRDEVLRERFDWGRGSWIVAMALRIARLDRPVELPMLPAYGGCKSWVMLAEDVCVTNTRPVLSEEEFQARLAEFRVATSTEKSAQ